MPAKIVRLAVDATVAEGHEERFREIARTMAAASNAEAGTLAYEWFFSADGRQCRVVETYADGAAVLAHFQGRAVAELMPQILPFCRIDRFEIYGDPGPEVTAMATGFGARFFTYFAGISR